jgi:hypothetical protein
MVRRALTIAAVPSVSFTAVARPDEGGVLLIEVPAAAVRTLGPKQRPPVRVSLNHVEYRSTVAVYGGRYYLPVRREIREAAKLVAGKRATVTLELDEAPRIVDLPPDLRVALRAAGATPTFRAMSFSHQREHVDWVTSAKHPETRETRIARIVADALARSRAPRARGSRSSGRAAPRGS